MGRGDKKTAKGKRTIGSYGVSRPKKASTYPAGAAATAKAEVVEKPVAKKTAAKKTTAKKADAAE